MHRMIGKVYKSKKVWVIVRHSEDNKAVIATSNRIEFKFQILEIFEIFWNLWNFKQNWVYIFEKTSKKQYIEFLEKIQIKFTLL